MARYGVRATRTSTCGLHVARFNSELGTPVFSRKSRRGDLREDSFRRRDYWVQTVSDRDGTVLSYAVTSCDPDFRPTFTILGAAEQGRSEVNVVSRHSVIAGILARYFEARMWANYFQGSRQTRTSLMSGTGETRRVTSRTAGASRTAARVETSTCAMHTRLPGIPGSTSSRTAVIRYALAGAYNGSANQFT